jgi:hypothetical protein
MHLSSLFVPTMGQMHLSSLFVPTMGQMHLSSLFVPTMMVMPKSPELAIASQSNLQPSSPLGIKQFTVLNLNTKER